MITERPEPLCANPGAARPEQGGGAPKRSGLREFDEPHAGDAAFSPQINSQAQHVAHHIMCENSFDCMDASCLLGHHASRASPCLAGLACSDLTCFYLHPYRARHGRSAVWESAHEKTKSSLNAFFEVLDTMTSKHMNKAQGNVQGSMATLQQAYDEICQSRLQLCSIDQTVVEAFDDFVASSDIYKNPSLAARLKREAYRLEHALPALGARKEFEDAARRDDRPFIVIRGATGSGKSTQLPMYLAEMPLFRGRKIICTEPRKLAATALAQRVALEYTCMNSEVNSSYAVAAAVDSSSKGMKAQVIYMTERGLIGRLISDSDESFLKNVGAIVIDEAHERSLSTDILLGLAKKWVKQYPTLRVVIMSATLEPQVFERFYGKARTSFIDIPGRLFPVEVKYCPPPGDGKVSEKDVFKITMDKMWELLCHSKTQVDCILAFLTGQDEVDRACKELQSRVSADKSKQHVRVFGLHGNTDPADQQAALNPIEPGLRKAIFCTNIAETSITIDGVRHVIDAGLCKATEYDPVRNLSTLRVMPISRSSADQRKGRAGRTAPGTCYRLYEQSMYNEMDPSTPAEVFLRPLALTVVTLFALRQNPRQFDWFEAPPSEAVEKAASELEWMEAVSVDAQGRHILSPIGDIMSRLQVEAGSARMLYKACERGLGSVALTMAAILPLGSRVLWRGGTDENKAVCDTTHETIIDTERGDITTSFNLFLEYIAIEAPVAKGANGESGPATTPNYFGGLNAKRSAWCMERSLNNRTLSTAAEQLKTFQALVAHVPVWSSKEQPDRKPTESEVEWLVMHALLLNIACRSGSDKYTSVFSNVVGRITSRSSIADSAAKGGYSETSYIIYQSILRTYSTSFLHVHRLANIAMWFEIASPLVRQRYLAIQPTLERSVVIIENQAPMTLLRVAGTFGMNIPAIERELDCSLDLDITNGRLIAMCPKAASLAVQEQITGKLEQARESIQNEVMSIEWPIRSKESEDIKSDTRVVVGRGLEILDVLFEGQSNQVKVENVVASLDEKDIFALVRQGLKDTAFTEKAVRACYVYQLVDKARGQKAPPSDGGHHHHHHHHHGSARDHQHRAGGTLSSHAAGKPAAVEAAFRRKPQVALPTTWALITLESYAAALAASKYLSQQKGANGDTYRCQIGAGDQHLATVSNISGEIRISYATEVSSGSGRIFISSLQQAQLIARAGAAAFPNSKWDVKEGLSETNQEVDRMVTFSRLPLEVDEAMLASSPEQDFSCPPGAVRRRIHISQGRCASRGCSENPHRAL